MKALRLATAFRKDLKRVERRGYDGALLEAVVDALRRGEELPKVRRDHALKGEWKGWRECHVQPDWLLIYKSHRDGGAARANGHSRRSVWQLMSKSCFKCTISRPHVPRTRDRALANLRNPI